MAYSDELHQLGEDTEQQVLTLWQRVESGELSLQDYAIAAAALLAAAAERGALLAAASLWAESAAVGASGGSGAAAWLPAPSHYTDRERLARAILTAAEDSDSAPVRLGRLARGNTVEATQRSYSQNLKRNHSSTFKGWTRKLDADPCQLCRWWHRDGRVWPAGHTMPTHTGCECSQQLVRTVHKPRPVQS